MLGAVPVAEALARLGGVAVKQIVREVLEECRGGGVDPADVVTEVLARLPGSASSLRPVLNATGIVVHTNLGRSPLSPAAIEAVALATGATDVELDLATGRRARRGIAATAALAARVPAAGGVHVVNNGAGALALVTCALAAGREVVVARGELVEIGDGFRIPELLESVGARVREVGTTNRVRLADYERAIGPDTAFVLKVHPSNFKVEGFTSSVSVAELSTLPRAARGRHRVRVAGSAPATAGRARCRNVPRSGRRPGDRLGRQAPRWPAVRSPAGRRRPRRAAAPASPRTCPARRQADARSPGGDAPRPGAAGGPRPGSRDRRT